MPEAHVKRALARNLFVLSSLLMVPVTATAQTVCNGTLSGTYDDVINTGGKCILDGATIRGSVMVTRGTLTATNMTQISGSVMGTGASRITVTGATQVNGSIQADAMNRIEVLDATVLGGVSLISSGNLTIGSGALVTSVTHTLSGRLTIRGSVGSVEAKESGRVLLDGATVFAGSVVISKGTGNVELCSSTIEGELKISETNGRVIADAAATDCGSSAIDGTVSIEKGDGRIRIVGAMLAAGDLIIVEQSGDIVVDDVTLGDIKVEKVAGSAMLRQVTADSDTTFTGNGDVTIQDSTLGGDVKIEENGRVRVIRNGFSLEDVSIAKNAGPVVFTDNFDFSIEISENDEVRFERNTFTDADISKNSGGVSISSNTGEVLKCSDNSPAPTDGRGNKITELTDGQCAGF